MSATQKVQVKRVVPYPIEVLITPQDGRPAYSAKVIRANTQGVFIEDPTIYAPNAKFQVEFELPVLKHSVKELVLVRKVYDQYRNPASKGGSHVRRLMECHFVNIDQKNKQQIFSFMNKINQKD